MDSQTQLGTLVICSNNILSVFENIINHNSKIMISDKIIDGKFTVLSLQYHHIKVVISACYIAELPQNYNQACDIYFNNQNKKDKNGDLFIDRIVRILLSIGAQTCTKKYCKRLFLIGKSTFDNLLTSENSLLKRYSNINTFEEYRFNCCSYNVIIGELTHEKYYFAVTYNETILSILFSRKSKKVETLIKQIREQGDELNELKSWYM